MGDPLTFWEQISWKTTMDLMVGETTKFSVTKAEQLMEKNPSLDRRHKL